MSILDAALYYHTQGFPVLPVMKNKAPYVKFGDFQERWLREGQTEEDVRFMFDVPDYPRYGIALLMWPYSNLMTIDFDGPHSNELWNQTGIGLPETCIHHTPSGFCHFIYNAPPNPPPDLRKKVRLVEEPNPCGWKGGGCGVDFLINGYAIVPPTPGYREDPDRPFGSFAELPEEVLALVQREDGARGPGQTKTDEDQWVKQALEGPVHKGQRNDIGTRLAGHFIGKGLRIEEALARLTQWGKTACVPPLDAQELRKLEDAAKRFAGRREEKTSHPVGIVEDTPGSDDDHQRIVMPGRFTSPLSQLLSVPDEPIPYLADRLIVAEANGFIGGEPKSLKSWLALYIALCLSGGKPIFGKYAVPKPVKVLYLQEEDGERRVMHRIRKILAGLELDPPSDEFFRYSIKAGVLFDDSEWFKRLQTELAEYRPGIVIGDVFELMHFQDSDKRKDMKFVFRNLDRLREEFGCGFLLTDHFKKSSFGGSRRGGQRLSGTVGKHAWGENSLYLFLTHGANRVRVETELKDAPSEVFCLSLEDTEDGAVVFKWETEAEDRTEETKEKVLAALGNVDPPDGWVPVAEVVKATGISKNTVRKYLDLLVDEDNKAKREMRKIGKTKAWCYRLIA